MSLKQNRIIKIVMEFVKAGTSYDITGIDLGLAKFFYRESQMLFQDLATGDYTISTGGGKQILTITNPELLAKIEAFQVAYVLDFDASKYDTQWNVDINTLKDKYNQLLDVTFNVWEYVRKIGFVADDTAMQIILPQLNTGEVWVKTDIGWRGLNVGDIESNINAFWVEFNKKTQEILEQIVTAGKVQEGLLEDFTQQKIKEINEEGLKLEVTQVGHGFIFNAVQFDKTTGAYTKADVNTGADGIAVRIDDDRFYLSSNGIIEIPANAVDSKGNPYELDEYYFLDNEVAGGCTPEKPIHIFQALFCVVNKKGVKSALVEIGDPIDLNPRILVDEINSLGLATTDQVVLSEPTIADLIASKKYKVGDIVEVLGYYEKGDGGGHPRQKKPVGYTGADAVIGVDGSIWGIVHNGEVNVSWFGARIRDDITDTLTKAFSINPLLVTGGGNSYFLSEKVVIKSKIKDFRFKLNVNGGLIFDKTSFSRIRACKVFDNIELSGNIADQSSYNPPLIAGTHYLQNCTALTIGHPSIRLTGIDINKVDKAVVYDSHSYILYHDNIDIHYCNTAFSWEENSIDRGASLDFISCGIWRCNTPFDIKNVHINFYGGYIDSCLSVIKGENVEGGYYSGKIQFTDSYLESYLELDNVEYKIKTSGIVSFNNCWIVDSCSKFATNANFNNCWIQNLKPNTCSNSVVFNDCYFGGDPFLQKRIGWLNTVFNHDFSLGDKGWKKISADGNFRVENNSLIVQGEDYPKADTNVASYKLDVTGKRAMTLFFKIKNATGGYEPVVLRFTLEDGTIIGSTPRYMNQNLEFAETALYSEIPNSAKYVYVEVVAKNSIDSVVEIKELDFITYNKSFPNITLRTLDVFALEKLSEQMKTEGVYDDFLNYKQDVLTYEESEQSMSRKNILLITQKPKPSESLLKFKEKHLQ